jgi:hypothetical protein
LQLAVQFLECDIAIIGGGFGGVAAALAAAEAGKRVVVSEPTDWIGGQVTAQAVAPLDEHFYIETFGGTRSYYRFREGVRTWYREHYPSARLVSGAPFNPGSGWVSKLCYEPGVALQVLEDMLAPHIEAGRLRILRNYAPKSAEMRNGRIYSVILTETGDVQETFREHVEVRAQIYLDASEMGDLLALSGAPFVIGAESIEDTGEPHASKTGAKPQRVQSFAFSFVVEYRPGENHTIRKPYGYEHHRQAQPYSLVLRTRGGGYRRFCMFDGEAPFWTYRRIFDAAQLAPGSFADVDNPRRDIAVINWDASDYYKENLIDRSPAQQARILREARRLALGFLYWLQTEAPHDNGKGKGYPGLKLLPQAVGTTDGVAKAPYIREGRRVIGFRRVLEQDIVALTERDGQPDSAARALHYPDTIGVGWYPIDLHRCAGDPIAGGEERIDYPLTLPFQIPLGAMLSRAIDNLVAACKNIGTTHITNGAYRLHLVEWAIGEAAGALAAACVSDGVRPRVIWENPERLHAFQMLLLSRGMPLVWTVDMSVGASRKDSADFSAIQSCLLETPLPENSPRYSHLEIRPDDLLSRPEGAWFIERSPRAKHNPLLRDVLTSWKENSLGPFSGADWRAACAALDLPSPESSDYPTLRQVCRKLVSAED